MVEALTVERSTRFCCREAFARAQNHTEGLPRSPNVYQGSTIEFHPYTRDGYFYSEGLWDTWGYSRSRSIGLDIFPQFSFYDWFGGTWHRSWPPQARQMIPSGVLGWETWPQFRTSNLPLWHVVTRGLCDCLIMRSGHNFSSGRGGCNQCLISILCVRVIRGAAKFEGVFSELVLGCWIRERAFSHPD